MTVKWVDGFDLYASGVHGDQMALIYSNVPGFPGFVAGRFGGLACQGAQGLECYPFGGAVSNLSVGFAYMVDGLGSTGQVCRLRTSNVDVCDMSVGPGGALRLTRAGTQLGTTATGVISINVWHYIELEFTRSATVGVFNLWVDGVRLLNLTAQNTGATDIDSIRFENQASLTLDDLYITDTAARLGECRVDTLRPTADTAQKDWTPSTGTSNFATVDDSVYTTTDYVSANAVGKKDYYDVADLTFNPANIYAVVATTMVKKDNTSTRTFRSNLKSGATEGHGTTRALTSSFTIFNDIFALDPNGSVAWTQSAVNAAQLGPEIVS